MANPKSYYQVRNANAQALGYRSYAHQRAARAAGAPLPTDTGKRAGRAAGGASVEARGARARADEIARQAGYSSAAERTRMRREGHRLPTDPRPVATWGRSGQRIAAGIQRLDTTDVSPDVVEAWLRKAQQTGLRVQMGRRGGRLWIYTNPSRGMSPAAAHARYQSLTGPEPDPADLEFGDWWDYGEDEISGRPG